MDLLIMDLLYYILTIYPSILALPAPLLRRAL